jgi:hypothetical protein
LPAACRLRILSIHNQYFSDLLHFLRRQRLADLLEPDLPRIAVAAHGADLDQFVRLQ